MNDLDELRERVARACRILGKLELTNNILGHISARVPGTDRILIRARGPGQPGVRFTTADDVIEVDLNGRKVAGREGLTSPGEVAIHTSLYRARPEVNGVVHAHPATAVLFTCCDKPLLPIIGAFNPSAVRLWREGIPTYPRSVLVADDELGRELADLMRDRRACLMRGHGITTVGPDVEEATLTAIALNDLAEMNYRAYLLGDPKPIPDDELESVVAVHKRNKEAGASPLWSYYCELLGES
jgi:ribulose-5-phosphate 4-epimerase/fuculose-1-phosphate aldolase